MSEWQKQNFKKTGSSAPSSMHSKIGTGSSTLHSKIAPSSVPKYADGGSFDQGEFAGVDAAIARNDAASANAETATGEWARGENYGDGTTGQERVDAAKAPAREASNDEVRAAMQEGEAKQAPRQAVKRSAPRPAPRQATPSVDSDESAAETNRLRSANSSASTQARTVQPAKSNGTYRGMDGVVRAKAPETKSEPMDIGGALSRGASAVGGYLSSLVKSPERKPVTYRGMDGKMHKSGE